MTGRGTPSTFTYEGGRVLKGVEGWREKGRRKLREARIERVYTLGGEGR